MSQDLQRSISHYSENRLNPIEAFKLISINDEIFQKINFLNKILQADDGGGTEIAGQQINKLLTEQLALEDEYLKLIKNRK